MHMIYCTWKISREMKSLTDEWLKIKCVCDIRLDGPKGRDQAVRRLLL